MSISHGVAGDFRPVWKKRRHVQRCFVYLARLRTLMADVASVVRLFVAIDATGVCTVDARLLCQAKSYRQFPMTNRSCFNPHLHRWSSVKCEFAYRQTAVMCFASRLELAGTALTGFCGVFAAPGFAVLGAQNWWECKMLMCWTQLKLGNF